MIPLRTLAAYRATEYRVRVEGQTLTFRVGRPAPALAGVLRRRRVRTAGFVTACNPGSRPTAPRVNAIARRRLDAWIRRRGLRALPGEGADPSGRWPAEPSLLVPGLGPRAARRLGRRFRQNAVVIVGPHHARTQARLLLCR